MSGTASLGLRLAAAAVVLGYSLAPPAVADSGGGHPALATPAREALDAFAAGWVDRRMLAVLFRDQGDLDRALGRDEIRAPLYRRARVELAEISGRLAAVAVAEEGAELASRIMASVAGAQAGEVSDGVILVRSRAQAQAIRARYDDLAAAYLAGEGVSAAAGGAWSQWMDFAFMADPREVGAADYLAVEDLNEPCYRRDALSAFEAMAQSGRPITAVVALGGAADPDRTIGRKRAKIAALLDNPDLLSQPRRMVDFYETMAEEPRRTARIAAAAAHLRRRFHLPPLGQPLGADVARLWVREDADLSELAAGHPFRRAAEADAIMALAATYAELQERAPALNSVDQVAVLLERLSESDRATLLERIAAVASPAFAADAAGLVREQNHALRAQDNAEAGKRAEPPNRRNIVFEHGRKSNTARPSLKRGVAQFGAQAGGAPPR